MKKLLLGLIVSMTSLLASDNLSAFLNAYKKNDAASACSIGRKLFHSGLREEKILIAIGKACAEDDYLNFTGVLQQRLGESAQGRKAGVYFSTLLLKKRLISQYMFETIDLRPYTLPKTEHILSLVFESLRSGNFTMLSKSPKHIRIGDEENYLDLYVSNKIHVDVYKDTVKIQEHRYSK